MDYGSGCVQAVQTSNTSDNGSLVPFSSKCSAQVTELKIRVGFHAQHTLVVAQNCECAKPLHVQNQTAYQDPILPLAFQVVCLQVLHAVMK